MLTLPYRKREVAAKRANAPTPDKNTIVPIPLNAPEAFGIVEPNVYRSNAPYSINFPFLKNLKIKTVVYLSPEVPMRAVTNFLEENNINMIHLGRRNWRPETSWKPVSEELMKDALEIVLDATKHPVMVVCTSGIHQTGTLVGCLRRMQHWNLTPIVNEYRSYAATKARLVNEQFIELFDIDLVTLPANLPDWWIEQQRMLQDEEDMFAELEENMDAGTQAGSMLSEVRSASLFAPYPYLVLPGDTPA